MAVPSKSPIRKKSGADEVDAVVAAEEEEEVMKDKEAVGNGGSQRKRTKDPGLRVQGGRIYCPVNGKTCHQCRQKTLDFSAECKNMKGSKQCVIKFCQKCLMNRYGEDASEVVNSNEWHCPKCRGICNCSFCMKKRGQQPTGILVHTAKKTGFSSVYEMLNGSPSKVVHGGDQLKNETPASNKKQCQLAVLSPSKVGKENSIDKDINSKSSMEKPSDKSSKKRKSEGLKEIHNASKVDADFVKDKPLKSMGELKAPEKKKHHIKAKAKKKLNVFEDGSTKEKDEPVVSSHDECRKETQAPEVVKSKVNGKIPSKSAAKSCGSLSEKTPAIVPLPSGTPLTTVAGVDLPAEAIGDALQFMEFCAAFGKVLDLRKGQPESLLRELVSSRRRRTGHASVIVRFHMQLLSFLQEDSDDESSPSILANGKNSWLKALKEYASKSRTSLGELALCLDGGADGYDNLRTSKKLRLLNFLCDEVLSTDPLRIWMEEQITKYKEVGKEAREKVLAAKTKEKLLKQRLQNDLAEAIIAKNGVPLTLLEHEAIFSKLKDELAQARADALQAKTSNKRQSCDVVRSAPLFSDVSGHAFWKLKASTGESDVLLQDLGRVDSLGCDEKWFIYEPEKQQAINTYISTMTRRHRVLANPSDSEQQQKSMA
ncbi:hypothetical protein SAY87_026957 [Trapa incisa]|uniref:DDT domain-containing protein n=1 Tax=Trapa incisa TaxID=236973 RepID=A0AAN7GYL2_9MYRT|nr:hypothetical protein SAY87_026957 [Trapa incisa]